MNSNWLRGRNALMCGLLVMWTAVGEARLNVAAFSLAPQAAVSGGNVRQVRDAANSTLTVIKTLLYSATGESAAAAQGRRMWYDPNTLSLTVTDTPERLRMVRDYVRQATAGAETGARTKSEILELRHQPAPETAAMLQRVLGAGTGVRSGGLVAPGNRVTKTLRVEGELVFRDLRLRVTRIDANDASDQRDDSVSMVIRTATRSENRTIQEYEADRIDDYEINVIDVTPGSEPGRGTARIEVVYYPASAAGFGVYYR